jgi:hypothetical protein
MPPPPPMTDAERKRNIAELEKLERESLARAETKDDPLEAQRDRLGAEFYRTVIHRLEGKWADGSPIEE